MSVSLWVRRNEHVDAGEDPGSPSLVIRYLSMNYQKLVKQLRGGLESSVDVPGRTSLEEGKVGLGSQDDDPLLRVLVVVYQHGVSVERLYEGGVEFELSQRMKPLNFRCRVLRCLSLVEGTFEEVGLGRWRRAASEAPRLTESRIWEGGLHWWRRS